jgi:uncharacterized protein (TIGR02265 family)
MPLAPSEVVPVETWVVFASGAEGIKAMLGNDATPELLEKLKGHGLDLSKPPLPAYPAEQFEAWVRVAAQALFPDATPGQGQRLLGRRFFDGWKGTFIGAAATAFLRVVGPRRAVGRVGRVFRYGNNFTVTHETFLSETNALVEFAQTQELADFIAGVVEAAFVLMRVKGEVTIVSRGNLQFVLGVSWDPGAPAPTVERPATRT